MKEGLFRKKSMERVSSPEQLDDYIKVSNPGVWMILACVIILLAGMCVWGILGRMDTTVLATAISKNGETVCYVKEDSVAGMESGMTVRIGEDEYKIVKVATSPIQIDEDFEAYALHVGSLQLGEWVYEIVLDAELEDGIYEAEIVTESIAPMSFLWK